VKTEGNLAISVVGLDELDRKVLRVAVGLLSVDGVNYQLLAKNSVISQLVVIDVDSDKGKAHLSRTNENQLKLLLGSGKFSAKNTVAMAKPMRVSSLKELLEKVYQRLQSSSVHSIVAQAEKAHTVPAPSPTGTLFTVLYQAKQQKQVLELRSRTDTAALYINGVNGTVAAVEKDHGGLDRLLKLSPSTFVISEISATDFEEKIGECVVSALDACLWKAGVCCSTGEILQGHSMDSAVKLKAWPGFTRHDFKPAYFKIAAILARHAISLNKLVAALKVPEVEIINFYNAAYAVGLIDIVGETRSEPVSAVHNEVKPALNPLSSSKSLFSKLARRLGFTF